MNEMQFIFRRQKRAPPGTKQVVQRGLDHIMPTVFPILSAMRALCRVMLNSTIDILSANGRQPQHVFCL